MPGHVGSTAAVELDDLDTVPALVDESSTHARQRMRPAQTGRTADR
jgi:hypothetical protein